MVKIDLYTCLLAKVDGTYKDLDDTFDNIYFSPEKDMSPDGLLRQCQIVPYYDVIDLQFHQTARHINAYKKLGSKILFAPMESIVSSLNIDLTELFKLRRRLPFRVTLSKLKQAIGEWVFCFKADEVVCVSTSDAAILRSVTGSKKITTIETGISPTDFQDAFASITSVLQPEYKTHTIIYVAYFGSVTNIAALQWFIEKVHPQIKSKIPNYVLQVVGRGDLSPFKSADDSIELVGEVAYLGPYITKAKLGIAPALGGSGFRGKVNQYAIYGVPSVVSPISANGLAYENGVDIFIAESADDFAENCISLLLDDDLNQVMGYKARAKALSNYSWESKLDSIKRVYLLEELN
ncbi:MAG: glycosyltransferase family 4 protein [Gallionella sp.]|nr:glycosyltransferase family 4 protein [Gallionella sp.]